jgi:hypothetical protein
VTTFSNQITSTSKKSSKTVLAVVIPASIVGGLLILSAIGIAAYLLYQYSVNKKISPQSGEEPPE